MTSDRKPRPAKNNQRKPAGVDELDALWALKGKAAIETLRTYDPAAYIAAIARLVGS
jgi:hypothetical protein